MKGLSLPLDSETERLVLARPTTSTARAIEDDSFPFEALSDIAEVESWRKEINRPSYHIHKWWAHRLGTVFRAVVIATFAPKGSDVLSLFHKPVRIDGAVVFDPFMGSGTTLGETLKLGGRAIGRDINPVAHFLVRNALAVHDRGVILRTFREIERDVAAEIQGHYRATLDGGNEVDVLYFFWVKVVDCPSCQQSVELFSSRIFSQHAYPKKNPSAQALCPHCGAVNGCRYDSADVTCAACARGFDPKRASAMGQKATCPSCNHTFAIAKTIRSGDGPPRHRLFAKMVSMPDGSKAYLAASDDDRRRYALAEALLKSRQSPYPVRPISPGFNTDQVLGYNYRYWHEMFNARQLLCLSILSDRIRTIRDHAVRDLFTCLFSGTLEFNNMFASFKGEGTGAVRHMFAHHILKPERVPLEAHVWGTPKSSGSFSTMFAGRIRRALDYAEQPFEIRIASQEGGNNSKVFGLCEPLGSELASSFGEFKDGKRAYVSCGDSAATDLADRSVDAVISDPPFFDNVHYSELADFFHVWQCHILGHSQQESTRSDREVQNKDAASFTDRLTGVWKEANRVLRDDGILTFSYHHSRNEGWRSILQALMTAGFAITAAHPIKSEMSVAMPKHQAKEPIDLDVLIVCRKRRPISLRNGPDSQQSWDSAECVASEQLRRFAVAGRSLSRGDVRIIVTAQLLRRLSGGGSVDDALSELDSSQSQIESFIERAQVTTGGVIGLHGLLKGS